MRKLIGLILLHLMVAQVAERTCSSVTLGGTCAICNNNLNYFNDGKGGCFSYFSQSCSAFDENGYCLKCISGTPVVGSGFCFQTSSVSNCAKYNLNGTCAFCSNGYYLNTNGMCSPVTKTILNCAAYYMDGFCLSCAPNYVLRSNVCVQSIQGCYVQSGIQCASCITSAFKQTLAPPTTIMDRTFWPIKNRNDLATSGLYNYSQVLYGTSPVCMVNSDINCLIPSSAKTCAFCSTNYYPDSTGFCVPVSSTAYIANCLLYSGASSCIICKSGYYLVTSNGITTCVQNPVSQLVTNCLYYSSPNTCLICNVGYYLASSLLCTSTTAVQGCAIYSSSTTCSSCLSNYYYSSTISCLPMTDQIVSNCATYSNLGCTSCSSTYSLNTPGGICSQVAATSQIPNCLKYNSGTCTLCQPGYFYNSVKNACQMILDPNCRFFDNTGMCQVCASTYYLDTNKLICQILPASPTATLLTNCYSYAGTSATTAGSVTCQLCNSGFYGATCTTTTTPQANCVALDITGNTCAICSAGYYLSSGACSNSPALTIVTGCASYSTSANCQYCASGYVPSGSTSPFTCQAYTRISNCSIYAAFNSCAVCTTTYYIITGPPATCSLAPVLTPITGCTNYSAIQCIECGFFNGQQYYLINGGCSVLSTPLPNCLYHSTPYTCSTCNVGYYLSTGLCVAVPSASLATLANCQEVGAGGTSCTYCAQGYYLNTNNICTQLTGLAGCLAYATATTCSTCDTNSFLTATGTCQLITTPITSCLMYTNANTCGSCASGSALTTDGKTCIPNCISATNICTNCATNYYWSINACVPVASLQLVPNCIYYSDATTCSQCSPNYLLQNNACTFIREAAYCQKLVETTTCSLCLPGYILTNGTCVAVGGGSVAGCLISLNGKDCNVCDKDHYQLTPAGSCAPNDQTFRPVTA